MTRDQRIKNAIIEKLNPLFLEVHNESSHHHVPKGSETHFKVVVVSEQFQGFSRIQRHRLLNSLLAQEFQTGLHALSLHAYTTEEWEKRTQKSPDSPYCKDGFDS
jgi:BolA family transcriptional regulator, general stress-responsive regulator